MKKIFFITTLLLSLPLFSQNSQNFDVVWGPVFKASSSILDVYSVNGNSFYARGYSKKKYSTITRYENWIPTTTTKFKCVVNQKPTEWEGTFEVDDKILIFTSQDNEEKTTKTLFVHEFKSSETFVEIEGEKIVSFDYDSKNKNRSYFSLQISENKKRICVSYTSSMRKVKDHDKNIFGYYILDENLKVTSEGTFADIFEESFEKLDRFTLSNDGELFLITRVNQKDEPATVKFYKVKDDETKVLEIDLEGNYINNMRIKVDKSGNFVMTGFYGKTAVKGVTKGTGVRGVFFAIMDPRTEEILSSGFNEFDDAFIMEGLSSNQKEKAEKRKEKKDIEPSLFHFQMRHFEPTDDGGSFGVAEEYFMTVTTTRDAKTGATTTTYHYHYNDLIAFKLDKSGALEWKKKILKNQHSTNDYGAYSSFVLKQTKDHAYIMFNDNLANYDPVSKKFIEGVGVQRMMLNKKKGAIAYVDIDLSSGEVSRSVFSELKVTKSLWAPKSSIPSEEDASILMIRSSLKGTQIGRITFE